MCRVVIWGRQGHQRYPRTLNTLRTTCLEFRAFAVFTARVDRGEGGGRASEIKAEFTVFLLTHFVKDYSLSELDLAVASKNVGSPLGAPRATFF